LEDLNNILNTGEVPNMWGPEDYDEILNEMRAIASKEK
jgi:dynein heavy chain